MEFIKKTNQNILVHSNHILKDDVTVPLLHFPMLEQLGLVEHCFSTRMGGVSEGIYESMNFSFTRGDDPEAVKENYRRVAQAIHAQVEAFVTTDQTHTTNVRKVTKEDAGKGVTKPRDYTDVDGLITNEQGVVLSTFYADCVPLYFVDPVHKAIGLSHSGWRGTVRRMGKVTLEAMREAYGTNPAEVYAAVGPSICQECYEISEEVAEQFYQEFPKHGDELLRNKGNGKYQLDLWKTNEIILLEAGILPEHLAVTNICTCCNEKLLFSHRASKGKRGNLGAFLMLK
ncbi:MAG: peptidoglycan editing factor PgeF [Agathobacter sp.]|nr:peptidoglycan editing factor PgeF [Agathobacter sp.]